MTDDDEMALTASRAVIDVAKDWIKVYLGGGEPVLGLHDGGVVGEPATSAWRPGAVVIREDRLLLAELGRLNTDVVPMAMSIMDQSATPEEHYAFAERLAAMARRLQDRTAHVGLVIDGEVAITADQNVNGSAGTIHHQDL